jgi:hypothetical protein
MQHLMKVHIAKGLSAADARCAAMRAMDGIELRKEECRDLRGIGWRPTAAIIGNGVLVSHLFATYEFATINRWTPSYALCLAVPFICGSGHAQNLLEIQDLPIAH